MIPNYPQTIPSDIPTLLTEIDATRVTIDQHKSTHAELWSTIWQKLRVDWTYDSNAIEGSTLTRGETLFFLQEGLTVEGKPFKDFLDAKNHAQAIDFLFDIIKANRPLSEGVIKDINALLLNGVTSTLARNAQGQDIQKPATPGQYKILPNHVLQQDGRIHHYTDPLQVQSEMATLVSWIEMSPLAPAITAAVSHYNLVRIHPFDDGNGRGARLLMNLILIKAGYPPAIIRFQNRRRYLETLAIADVGDLTPFITFVLESLQETQQSILSVLKI